MCMEAPGSPRPRSTSTNGPQKSIPYSSFTLDNFFFLYSAFLLSFFISEVFQATFFSLKLLSYLIHWKAQSYRPADGVLKSSSGFSYLYHSCSFAGTPVANETVGRFDPTLSCPHWTLLTIAGCLLFSLEGK